MMLALESTMMSPPGWVRRSLTSAMGSRESRKFCQGRGRVSDDRRDRVDGDADAEFEEWWDPFDEVGDDDVGLPLDGASTREAS